MQQEQTETIKTGCCSYLFLTQGAIKDVCIIYHNIKEIFVCFFFTFFFQYSILGRFYDGWYRPPGLKRMQLKYLQKISQQKKKAKKTMDNHVDAKAETTNKNNLSGFWSGKPDARVKCGPIPGKVRHCGRGRGGRYKPCLFNLKDDPCEYRDLSVEFPIIYEIMLRRLDEYRRKMAKPRMVTYRDPKADPKRWNGVWTPWKIHPSKLKNEKKRNGGDEGDGGFFGLFRRFPYSLKCEFAKK